MDKEEKDLDRIKKYDRKSAQLVDMFRVKSQNKPPHVRVENTEKELP